MGILNNKAFKIRLLIVMLTLGAALGITFGLIYVNNPSTSYIVYGMVSIFYTALNLISVMIIGRKYKRETNTKPN